MVNSINLFTYPSSISFKAGVFMAAPAIEMAIRALGDLGELVKLSLEEYFARPGSLLAERIRAQTPVKDERPEKPQVPNPISIDSDINGQPVSVNDARAEETNRQASEFKTLKMKALKNLGQNVLGAVVCGACAANAFPYASIIGTIAFCVWARMTSVKGNGESLNENACWTTKIVGVPLYIVTHRIVRLLVKEGVKALARQVRLLAVKIFHGMQKIATLIAHGARNVVKAVKSIFATCVKVPVRLGKQLMHLMGKLARVIVLPFKMVGKLAVGILHGLGKCLGGIGKVFAKSPKVALIVVGALALTAVCLMGGAALLSIKDLALSIGSVAFNVLFGVGKLALNILLGTGRFLATAIDPCVSLVMKVGELALNILGLAFNAVTFVAKPTLAVVQGCASVVSYCLSFFKNLVFA